MPRAEVTAELAETIRNIRIQNKISSRDLAIHINKSPAYISRLENGSIHSIDTEDLYSLLQFITKEDSFIGLAEEIYKSLTIKYSSKEIEEQLWFTNYDTVKCLIPIPDDLIIYIKNMMEQLQISRQILLLRINSNESLPEEEKNDSTIPFNQWYSRKESNGNAHSIKIHLTDKALDDILDGKLQQSPYVFILAIVFYLLKIEEFNNTVSITNEEDAMLMKKAKDLLNQYKFYSIAEKKAELSRIKSEEDFSKILNSFDTENIEIINDILAGFEAATNHNIADTNEKLKMFKDNMHWDLGFMLRLISLEYKSMDQISISNRKKFLAEVSALITKYQASPNQIEDY